MSQLGRILESFAVCLLFPPAHLVFLALRTHLSSSSSLSVFSVSINTLILLLFFAHSSLKLVLSFYSSEWWWEGASQMLPLSATWKKEQEERRGKCKPWKAGHGFPKLRDGTAATWMAGGGGYLPFKQTCGCDFHCYSGWMLQWIGTWGILETPREFKIMMCGVRVCMSKCVREIHFSSFLL